MNKLLFLGYDESQTNLISELRKRKNIQIDHKNSKISLKIVKKYDLVICYGYRFKINKEIINKYKEIINLHISYLPYNRGAHPNFWSFVENTPSGVTIHKVDCQIDSGSIIFQKLINFSLRKNKKNLTFRTTYEKLKFEVEKMFVKNFDRIINKKYKAYKQKGTGTFHSLNDLPSYLISWDQNIYEFISKYKKLKDKKI